MAYGNVAEQWAAPGVKRDQLFSDLADATHTDRPFRISEIVGEVPCIKRYAEKTQADILRALTREMKAETWTGDGLEAVGRATYRWRCLDWSAA